MNESSSAERVGERGIGAERDAEETTTTAGAAGGHERLAELADEFIRRHRLGERPSLDDYARRHPDLASEIRDVFPAMLALEQPAAGPLALDVWPASERVGGMIGRYKLLERIGEGGFGVVYMAEQQHPVRRKVALKVIKPGFDTRQVIARFEAERQALALMDHENIARVFDAGATESGRPYFVMELVRGVPITEFCDRNQLPPRERLGLFLQVCRAVQHAHTKGIIHRDLKPGNVLVTLHDGVAVPKVIDFGIAKATGHQLTEKTLFTNFAQMVGTPLYMSPEQAEMSGLDVDTRSDVYSLGVLLYELLTGTTPFDKERLKLAAFDEVRRIIREEEPPRPSTRLSTMGDAVQTISAQRKSDPRRLGQLVRGELDWIVMRAIEKDRTRRYESAVSLARDVERYLADEPVHACPPSLAYRVQKLVRRHGAALAVAGGFVLLLLAASIISTWLAVRATRAERQVIHERDQVLAETRQKQAALVAKQAALDEASRNERIAEERLAAGLIFAGHSQLKSKQAASARQSFAEAWELSRKLGLSETPPLAGILLTYAASPPPLLGSDGRPGGVGGFEGHTAAIRSADFSPDGQTLISGGWDACLRWWDVRTGAAVRDLKLDGVVTGIAISGDGTLFVATGETISAYDPRGRHLRDSKPGVPINGLAVSADGRWLLLASSDGSVSLCDAATLAVLGRFTGHTSYVHRVAFSPDLRRAFSTSENGDVGVWELPSGRRLAMFQAHAGSSITGLSLSPDGRMLATGSVDNLVKLWDAHTLQPLLTLEGHAGPVLAVHFSPDGRWLVSGSADKALRLWEAASGREVRVFTGHEQRIRSVRFSPDGTAIASADDAGRINLWTTRDEGEIPSFGGHEDRVISVAFSRDRRLALSGSFDRTLRLWDVPTGKTLRTFSDVAGKLWSVTLSPDGGWALAGGEDHVVVLIDLSAGEVVRRFKGHTDIITSVAFCPDSQTAVSGSSDGTVKLWNLDTGELLHTFTGHSGKVRGVTVSPDGRHLLSAGFDSTLKLWSIAERRHVRDFTGHSHWVMCAAFSPDGSQALSGSWDQSVRLWDVATGTCLRTIPAHYSAVLGVAFSGDGRTGASASFDGTIGLWELDSGAQLATLSGHGDAVTSVAFSPTELTFLSASRDGTIKVWDIERPRRYQPFFDRLRSAREALSRSGAEGDALMAFGHWYAFRGLDEATVDLLERARGAGATVSSLTLARSYWKIGRTEDARREFQLALRRQEAPAEYLNLCLTAVAGRGMQEKAPPPQTQPSAVLSTSRR